MMKFEWPLIVTDNANVKKLAQNTFDISEYIVDIAKKNGLAPGLSPVPGGVTLHIACHSRAQNMGQKATEMLKLLPEADVQVIERCSGHGGAWGFKKGNFDIAMKVGKPVARTTAQGGKAYVTSECPLAGVHIGQGVEALGGDKPKPQVVKHPIQIFARSYGIEV
jgi:glycerol-3-phosphate dehydrogenase subunit C